MTGIANDRVCAFDQSAEIAQFGDGSKVVFPCPPPAKYHVAEDCVGLIAVGVFVSHWCILQSRAVVGMMSGATLYQDGLTISERYDTLVVLHTIRHSCEGCIC